MDSRKCQLFTALPVFLINRFRGIDLLLPQRFVQKYAKWRQTEIVGQVFRISVLQRCQFVKKIGINYNIINYYYNIIQILSKYYSPFKMLGNVKYYLFQFVQHCQFVAIIQQIVGI